MRGKGTKLGEGERNLEGERAISGLLHSGLLPFSGFGIFTFGIVSFGKSLGRQMINLRGF